MLPHNIFIQAGSELGTLGFGALLLLMVLSFIVNKKTRTLARKLGEGGKFYDLTARGLDGAMIGFIGSAFFVTVLYYPFLWFGLGMTAALHATVAAAAARGRTVAAQGPLILAPVHGWRTWSSTAGKRVATQGSSRPQILARNP